MRAAIWFVVTMFAATACFAADVDVYPSRPVRVVPTFGPGSIDDLIGRTFSQQLSEQLGKQFLVDNRTGASGAIGKAFVAKSAPDGYTLLIADTSLSILPSTRKSPPFDAIKDFTPITQIARVPFVLVVRPSLNVNTLKEFIVLAQANPGKFNYGTSGVGTLSQLASELLKITAKVDITGIQYKDGTAAAMTALLGDQIEMLMTSIPTVLAQVKSEKLRALAVATEGKRVPSMPNVPTMSEAGISNMALYSWFGLAGPAGMPKEVVSKLHSEMVRALAVQSVKDQFVPMSAELVGSTPEEFSTYIRDEVRRWSGVVKSAGITPE